MPQNPWEYAVAVAKVWGLKISGPLFGFLGIAAAIAAPFYASSSDATSVLLKTLAWIFGVAAAWSIVSAQYVVWRTEHEARELQIGLTEAERARNARPEIRGVVIGFCTTGPIGDGVFNASIHCTTVISFQMQVTNFRQVTTSIVGIRIDGAALRIPAQFENAEVWRPQLPGSPEPHSNRPELVYAVHAILAASANVTVEGYHWNDIGNTLDLTGLKVELVDGLGGVHAIDVDLGSSISVR